MSLQRRCDYIKAVDQQWYMILGDREHAHDDIDCTAYGPFPSAERADQYRIDNFQNPGGSMTDGRGVLPVPADVVKPLLEEEDDLLAAFDTSRSSRRPGL